MSTATVRDVAKDFLLREGSGILALKGAWGVGKTHAWRDIVEKNRNAVKPPKYAYVSLFGVRSISELRLAIVSKERPAKDIGMPLTVDAVKENLWTYTKSTAVAIAQRVKNIPQGATVNLGLEAFAGALISSCVVCLDDFERMSKSIATEELLGFISELKEERDCKVVLIFNEDRLGDKAQSYKQYREKVIDIELEYAPTPREAAEIAFAPEFGQRELAIDCAVRLKLNNIRILRRGLEVIELIHPVVKNLHPKVLDQTVISTVLFVWSFYGEAGSGISFDRLRSWNDLSWHLRRLERQRKGQSNEDDEKLGELLQQYGYTSTDEYDLAIMRIVERGYIQNTGLTEAAEALDKKFQAGDLEASFTKAWNKFHYTFENNRADLIASLKSSFDAAVDYISPINLNGTVGLLRQLGEDALADELIEKYIGVHGKNLALFDLEDYAFAGELSDPRLRKRFEEHYAASVRLPSLDDVMADLLRGTGVSKAALLTLEKTNEDEFYSFFKRDHGENLQRIVKAALSLEAQQKAVGERVRAALRRIGEESDLNAVRLERYGIKVAGK